MQEADEVWGANTMLLSDPQAFRAFQAAEHELESLERCSFAPENVAMIQASKLARVWELALATRYYAPLLGSKVPRLEGLPLTPKSAVKETPELFYVLGGRPSLKYYETSGTTGTPTPTPRLAEDIVWNTLSVASAWRRVVQTHDRVVSLLPSDVVPIGDLISYVCEYLGCCLVRCYPFAVGVCDWERLQQMFLRYQPTCLFAAPGVLVQCMRLLKARGTFMTLKQSVSKIMLLGEVSTAGLRRMLAQNWEAEVYDASYGSTETGTSAATCEAKRLHALGHSFLLEIHAGDRVHPLQPGARGELVVTTLNNHARPLLRYATGDLVAVESGATCMCGLQLPTLTILGRKEERLCVNGVDLGVHAIEDAVYGIPGITGYMIEVHGDGSQARLLLEKDIDFPGDGEQRIAGLKRAFAAHGVVWDAVTLLHQLPSITKSGAGQKNWKKTNIRLVS